MVLINGKKFACIACVKGHRSSSCAHTDRALLEIGKKGRPPTQCSHCRELRRISKVHSKCMCGDKPEKRPRNPTFLPNGLADLEAFSLLTDSAAQASSSQQAINPCLCSTGGQCCCASPAHPSTGLRAKQKAQQKQQQPPTPCQPQPHLLQPNHGPAISSLDECAIPSEPLPTLPSCCGAKRSSPDSQGPSTGFHPYISPRPPTPLNLFPPLAPELTQSTSGLTLDQTFGLTADLNTNTTAVGTLFAPRTAGTALCFCGIHCPCPGCVLHDPLGLKFAPNTQSSACPTSLSRAEGCLGGLDLPTVNELLNLSPIAGSFSLPTTAPSLQLPSVSQTIDWQPLAVQPLQSCCGGKQTQDQLNVAAGGFVGDSRHVPL